MTLHNTVESVKKLLLGTSIGIGIIIMLVIFFRVSVFMWNVIFPPKVIPPTMVYDKLPALSFPASSVNKNLVYTINTVSGQLPTDFPDRLNIFPIVEAKPNFLNLDKAKSLVSHIGFLTGTGESVQEKALGNALYEWDQPAGLQKKININIVTFNFSLTSEYASSLVVLQAQNISDKKSAIMTAKSFLNDLTLLPDDIDLTKTQNPAPNMNYITAPQLFDINTHTGQLFPATNLNATKIIRVDFYQKDIEYELNTGRSNGQNGLSKLQMKLPVLYPYPPNSTMSFWIGSNESDADVVAADFIHQKIDNPKDVEATYPIKTVQQAYEELKQGKAYIAMYSGSSNEVLITNVFLAYYLGKDLQKYLMPIIVFEGSNNFFAYVSAVSDEWITPN
jgi:hypothetical protein